MKKFSNILLRILYNVELLLGLVLSVALIGSVGSLVINFMQNIELAMQPNGFSEYLNKAFSILIGVEFLKMLIKQTPGSVLEVLIFVIARQLVMNHGTTTEFLLGVLAIGGIFAIRKYLYVQAFDEENAKDIVCFPWHKKRKETKE